MKRFLTFLHSYDKTKQWATRINLATVLVLAAVSILVSGPAASAASSSALNDPTWNDYSLMFSRSAGQYHADGQAAGQWAWTPQNSTTSDISWGDPATWPPKSGERFIKSGDWVLLDGFSDGSGLAPNQIQRVSSEKIGDANCNFMTNLSSDNNRQHYVKWNIPATSYCLDAVGTITSTRTGIVVNFRHRQQWSAPTVCSNAYFVNQTCIIQHEQWWDDNGHPYALRHDRSQYIAQGLGMAFKVRQTYPFTWGADGRYYWKW
jgi:hypothetical protein